MTQISGNVVVEVNSIPDIEGGSKSTYCHTEDAKHSSHAGSDHPQRPYTNTAPLW